MISFPQIDLLSSVLRSGVGVFITGNSDMGWDPRYCNVHVLLQILKHFSYVSNRSIVTRRLRLGVRPLDGDRTVTKDEHSLVPSNER